MTFLGERRALSTPKGAAGHNVPPYMPLFPFFFIVATTIYITRSIKYLYCQYRYIYECNTGAITATILTMFIPSASLNSYEYTCRLSLLITILRHL
jgi:hypothetical protein